MPLNNVFLEVTRNTNKHNLKDHKTEARLKFIDDEKEHKMINNMKVFM